MTPEDIKKITGLDVAASSLLHPDMAASSLLHNHDSREDLLALLNAGSLSSLSLEDLLQKPGGVIAADLQSADLQENPSMAGLPLPPDEVTPQPTSPE